MVLALAWAVYLVPKALKHHDELARTRSIDRFSTAMRVLARREPVDRRSARLVVTPARSAERVLLPTRPVEPAMSTAETAGRPKPSPTVRRAAARAAARRRRRILSGLLILDLAAVGVAAFAVIPWWGVAVPAALTVLYLVLCRTQVRRDNDASWSDTDTRADGEDAHIVVPRRAIRMDAAYGTPQAARHAVTADEEFSPDEDTVQIPLTALETVAVSVETVDGGSLWDPLPVTLPTYVGKARAARTVRTIDLSAPGTWSSGRDAADTALVEEVAVAESEEAAGLAADEHEAPRAVGS